MGAQFDYDVLILGAGPGGYVGAIRAAQLGLKACLIEKDKPGGVCLNVGCIPSKNLLHQAELFRSRTELEAMGLSITYDAFDYAKVFERSRKAADTLSRGVQGLLKKNKVELVAGTGILTGKNEITVDKQRKITGKHIIIATGSRPRAIPGFDFDENLVLSSTGALYLNTLPKKFLILGAGAIGIEFAHIMNAFGVEVTLVEMLDRILPLEDEETVQVLDKSFRKRGVRIMTGTKALSLEKRTDGVSVLLEGKDGVRNTLDVDKALVVVGRVPNTEGIGLEALGNKTEKGFIPVGDYGQTSVPGIYAIGDVVNTPLLAHVASKEGEIAVEHIAGKASEKRIDVLSVPMAVYCEPQCGSFGYKEADLKAKNIPYKKATFPFVGIGKAVATGRAEGMVKVLFDPETHEILGAHVIGPEATELIHEMLLAKKSELLPEDIADMIHAHPTLSESVMEAMKASLGRAIHI